MLIEHTLFGTRDMVATAIERLWDALSFYATCSNWGTPTTGFAAQYDPESSLVAKDAGRIARTALAGKE